MRISDWSSDVCSSDLIGLINSLATFARVNKYGFIETPYRKIIDGKVTTDVVYLSAMEEQKHTVAQANADLNDDGSFIDELISAREAGEFLMAPRDQITLMDVSPKQQIGRATCRERGVQYGRI